MYYIDGYCLSIVYYFGDQNCANSRAITSKDIKGKGVYQQKDPTSGLLNLLLVY